MSTIDLSNYSTLLKQSTQSRNDTPDGNIYFDITNGLIEFIPIEELPQIDFGDGLVDNPLNFREGIKFEAIYAFENQERSTDEELRKHDRWTMGTFKAGGAYRFINGRTPAIEQDRSIIRSSGWVEYAKDKTINKIYFGNKGLGNIMEDSQPYYQLGVFTETINYSKTGQINEAVLVYEKDVVDHIYTPEIISVRTYGNTHDRKSTDIDLDIVELGGYSTGIAVNESVHLTTDPEVMSIDDVWNTPTGVWENMRLEKLSEPITVDEFAEEAGTFSWVLRNPDNATLSECIAWLDAAAIAETDIDSSDQTTTIGKIVNTWYTYNASGQVVTNSGADELGLYIENIPLLDRPNILFTTDDKSTRSYQYLVSIEVDIGEYAKNDTNAWYHTFGATNYNTPDAVTIKDDQGNEIEGLASNANDENKIVFQFPYDTDTLLGEPGTNKDAVFICEGDGGATQAKTLYTITRTTHITFTCAPGLENNP